MTILHGLDDACSACGRAAGDHTLREWDVCTGERRWELPFEETQPGAAKDAAGEHLRRMFNLDPDLHVADNVLIQAAVLDGASGPVKVHAPTLVHEFQSSVSGGPVTVCKVAFIGDPVSMRAYGRLVRDSANGAAKATERTG